MFIPDEPLTGLSTQFLAYSQWLHINFQKTVTRGIFLNPKLGEIGPKPALVHPGSHPRVVFVPQERSPKAAFNCVASTSQLAHASVGNDFGADDGADSLDTRCSTVAAISSVVPKWPSGTCVWMLVAMAWNWSAARPSFQRSHQQG
jgi:hypothetical protein